MDSGELKRAAAVAERACERARKEILSRFRCVDVEFKQDGSPVTEADRAAERAIRETLRDAYPDYGLLGEEYGAEDAASPDAPRWIIDPIDGTISFSRGIPLFGTLIALMVEAEPVVGVIDLPVLGERYVGWKGGGCRRNGERVRASQVTALRRCLVSPGDPICFEFAGRREVGEFHGGFLTCLLRQPACRGQRRALHCLRCPVDQQSPGRVLRQRFPQFLLCFLYGL